MTEKISIRQIKAARALLDWSQRDLADRSGASLPTIQRIEAADQPGSRATMERIVTAIETGGIEFIPENGGGAGVRLKKFAPGV